MGNFADRTRQDHRTNGAPRRVLLPLRTTTTMKGIPDRITDPARLAVISRLDLVGHLGDGGLNAVVETLAVGCRVPTAVVTVVTPGRQTYPAERGIGAACTEVSDDLSFCAEVVRTGSAFRVADAREHPVFAQNPLVIAGAVRAYAGEPLMHAGEVIGAVSIFDRAPRVFTAEALTVLHAQAQLAATVIALRASAAWDPMTGLASRSMLLDRMERALARAGRTGDHAALVVLNVTGMAIVNGTVGSAEGDRYLQTVAERLQSGCGPTDSVARVGGDAFAVLFDGVGSAEDARARSAALVTLVSVPVVIGGAAIPVTLRCGLATAPRGSADALLAAAERSATRASAKAFGADVDDEQASRKDELRRAIDGDELVLHYQPVVDLVTSRMVAVEALVRWQHPRLGLLSPAAFIPLAEEVGLIEDLGAWVLRAAAAQATLWQQLSRRIDIAVNLSPRQLADTGFAPWALRVLATAGASAEGIILEVTESALLDQPHATDTLATLRRAGIRLALDDFGTGYSSLSYLRRFPVDFIKIDRSFIAGLGSHRDDDAIVASVVSLARNTGKVVIAEGVETVEQLALLRSLGVAQAQGFLWARALPAAEVLHWADAAESSGLLATSAAPAPSKPRVALLLRPGSSEELIMAMHADGASLHTIAALLNSEGRRTTKGVRWHVRTVAQVIAAQVVEQPA